MDKNNLIKKELAIVFILLFIGFSIAPSINANVSKDSELFEITTEICGLNGEMNTVHITKEKAEEVEQLINDIERRLNKVETKEKAVEIFKEAIIELDEFYLLNGLSVNHLERVVDRCNSISKLVGFLNRFFMNEIRAENDVNNILCLVSTRVINPYSVWLGIAYGLAVLAVGGVSIPVWVISALFGYTMLKPFCLFLTIFARPNTLLFLYPEVLSYNSIGLFGIKRGGEWGTMFGFTGLKITILKEDFSSYDQWYFGFALAVLGG